MFPACLRTGCFLSYLAFIIIMTQQWNYLRSFQHFIAYSTISSCCLSVSHTGGFYSFNHCFCMTLCRYRLFFAISTFTTSVESHSSLRTGCSLVHANIIPVMSGCRKCFLGFQYLATCRTMSSFCFPLRFTACVHCGICYFCMACRFNCTFLGSSTSATGKSLLSIFRAGYFLSCFSFIPVMSQCGDIGSCNRCFSRSICKIYSTGFAAPELYVTFLCTGWIYCGMMFDRSMTFCWNCFFFGRSTSATGKNFSSLFCTGSFRDSFSFYPVMAFCWHCLLRFQYCKTY